MTRTVAAKPARSVSKPKPQPADSDPSTSPATTSGSAAPGYVACDGNISAKAPETSCGFAENVFYEYWTNGYSDSFTAYSPAAGTSFDVACSGADQITCTTSTGASVRFSMAAADAYTQEEADRYAGSHDLGDESGSTGDSSQPPDANQSSDDATAASAGDTDAADFCASHDCIPSFDEGHGYIVQCNDGEWSHSGGIQGACSSHEGESDTTYP